MAADSSGCAYLQSFDDDSSAIAECGAAGLGCIQGRLEERHVYSATVIVFERKGTEVQVAEPGLDAADCTLRFAFCPQPLIAQQSTILGQRNPSIP